MTFFSRFPNPKMSFTKWFIFSCNRCQRSGLFSQASAFTELDTEKAGSVARAGNRGFPLFIHSQIIEDNLVHFCGEIMNVCKKQGNGVSPFEWAAQVGPCGALT